MDRHELAVLKSAVWNALPKSRRKSANERMDALKAQGLDLTARWLRLAEENGIDVESYVETPADFVDSDGDADLYEALRLRELLSDGSRDDVRADVQWVRDHMDIVDTQVDEAPSPGAWSLLKWATENSDNRSDFYMNIWKCLMPAKAKSDVDEERRVRESSEDAIALVDRLRRTLKNVTGSVVRERDDSH